METVSEGRYPVVTPTGVVDRQTLGSRGLCLFLTVRLLHALYLINSLCKSDTLQQIPEAWLRAQAIIFGLNLKVRHLSRPHFKGSFEPS